MTTDKMADYISSRSLKSVIARNSQKCYIQTQQAFSWIKEKQVK
jgi:hypothetical protein